MTDNFADTPLNAKRRQFLRGCGVVMALGSGVMPFGVAQASSQRELRLFNTHTNERMQLCYFRDNSLDAEACQRLNHFLRDLRSGDVHPIDARLFDLLYILQHEVGHKGEVEIISGYRSPATNTQLRAASSGVAKGSLHLQGKALDIRLTGFDSARLRDAARGLQAGGVGYYAKSDFVHVDTGRVRTW